MVDLQKTYYIPSCDVFWHDGQFYFPQGLPIEQISRVEDDDDNEETYKQILITRYYPALFDENERKLLINIAKSPLRRTATSYGYKVDDDYEWDVDEGYMVTTGDDDHELDEWTEPMDDDEEEQLMTMMRDRRLIA